MIQQMLDLFVNLFSVNPSIPEVLLAWLLVFIFAAIWLAFYRPPLLTRPWLWAVLAGGAVLAPIALVITAFPLRYGVSLVVNSIWNRETLEQWALLASIPSMYLFALVREGFKLVPVVIYWWRNSRDIEPKLGLAAGAVSGAGFGIVEAQWMLNYGFYKGWGWESVQTQGLEAIYVISEILFVLGVQVASCALAGWGLAKGRGWQFYLLAAFVYFFQAYSYVLLSQKLITLMQAEFIIAAWAFIVTGVALWLREKKSKT